MKCGTVRNKSKSGDFQRKNFNSVLNKTRLNLITNVFVFVKFVLLGLLKVRFVANSQFKDADFSFVHQNQIRATRWLENLFDRIPPLRRNVDIERLFCGYGSREPLRKQLKDIIIIIIIIMITTLSYYQACQMCPSYYTFNKED